MQGIRQLTAYTCRYIYLRIVLLKEKTLGSFLQLVLLLLLVLVLVLVLEPVFQELQADDCWHRPR